MLTNMALFLYITTSRLAMVDIDTNFVTEPASLWNKNKCHVILHAAILLLTGIFCFQSRSLVRISMHAARPRPPIKTLSWSRNEMEMIPPLEPIGDSVFQKIDPSRLSTVNNFAVVAHTRMLLISIEASIGSIGSFFFCSRQQDFGIIYVKERCCMCVCVLNEIKKQ